MNPFSGLDVAPEEEYQGWQGKIFNDPDCPLPYRLKLPATLDDGRVHPLVLCMHGAGSIGSDNLRQLFIATLFTDNAPAAADAIVAAPQCPEGQYWVPGGPQWDAEEFPLRVSPTPSLAAVLRLLEELIIIYPVDFARIYVVGASMGGFAAWELLFRRSDLFAAAVIICGAGDPKQLLMLGGKAIKLFHGDADTTVPVRNSRIMVQSMNAMHRKIEYTEYPGVDHDAWTPALSDPATGEWLFAQRCRTVVSAERDGTPHRSDKLLKLSAHGFSALIAPAAGGNLFRLRDEKSGRDLLRTPRALDELYLSAVCFGIPLLFPPNRIDNGHFTFNGREYSLPITERRSNVHLHGLVAGMSWEVVRADAGAAVLRCSFGTADPRFAGFPHEFSITREYVLDADGLLDTTIVSNCSSSPMPLGLGFHTAFPADNVQVRMGAGDFQYEIGNRALPTGRKIPWDTCDPRQPFDPAGIDFDFHTATAPLTAAGNRTFIGAELRYPEGVLTYELDEKMGFWYTWNAGGFNNFFCLEPVSWMSNALNSPLPPAETGVRTLNPGMEARFVNRLRWLAV